LCAKSLTERTRLGLGDDAAFVAVGLVKAVGCGRDRVVSRVVFFTLPPAIGEVRRTGLELPGLARAGGGVAAPVREGVQAVLVRGGQVDVFCSSKSKKKEGKFKHLAFGHPGRRRLTARH
jgi:hypothetical protein